MTLEDIYSLIPDVHCKGRCQEACGPIACTRMEGERITGTRTSILPYDPETLTCSFLKGGRCSIYEDRPLVCRLYGTVRQLECPHGCKPDHFLSQQEQEDILLLLNQVANESLKDTIRAALEAVVGGKR